MSPLSPRERQELDRHITGNYGEDQFEEPEMTPEQEKAEADAEMERFAHRYRNQIDNIIQGLQYAKTVATDPTALSDSLSQVEELMTELCDEVMGRDCFDC